MTGIRNIIFWAHLTVGIIAGLVLLVIASTGMVLAFRPQIIAFAEKDTYRIDTPSTGDQRLSLQELLDKVQEDPDISPTGLTINANPHAPVAINLGENNALYMNPYTGAVLGHGSGVRQWMAQVEYWHRWLGMPGHWRALGGNIKRAVNLAFFFMIVTGLYLWWPRNWNVNVFRASTQLNFKLKGNASDWNWHTVIGFWAAPFLIIISLTGMIMSYPWANNLLYRMTGNAPPVMMGRQMEPGAHHHHHDEDADDQDPDSGAGLDGLFARAEQQASDWKTISLKLSRHADAPAVFNIEEPGVGHRSQLTLNPANAQVIKWEPYASQNSGRKLRTLVRFLHTGEAGGIIGQTIAFLAALGLLFIVKTGFAMAWKRFFQKKAPPPAKGGKRRGPVRRE